MGSLKGFLDLTTDISSTAFFFFCFKTGSFHIQEVLMLQKFYFFRIKAHGMSFFIFGNTSEGPLG